MKDHYVTTDWLWDIVKPEAIVVDIDGTFLNETWPYGKEVVNYDVLIEVKKHIQKWGFVIFLTNRDRWFHYDETVQSIKFYLQDSKLYQDYDLIANYFPATRSGEKHKASEIKNILKNIMLSIGMKIILQSRKLQKNTIFHLLS